MTAANQEARSALAALVHGGGRLRLEGEKVIVEWNGPRDAALAARLRAVKPELREMVTPFATMDELTAAALQVFGGTLDPATPEPPSADERLDNEWPLERRLACIERLLARRDLRGRIDFTRSEIDSCIIGLRSFADDPSASQMLVRLEAARKRALSQRELARRMASAPL